MANFPSTVSGNATISPVLNPVMKMMKDVIHKEDNRQILQTDLRRIESLLQYTAIIFRDQQKDPPEMVNIWLQLLQNSLQEANGLFDRWTPRQSCIDIVVYCNPGRLSKEIRDWNAVFDHLYYGFLSDLFRHIALSGNAMISVAVDPVMELLKDAIKEEDNRQILADVIEKDDNRQILQIVLRRIDSLLRDLTTSHFFQSQKEAVLDIMKTWLPLLANSLIKAKGQSFLEIREWRLSKEIRDWNAFFDHLCLGFLSDLVQHIGSAHGNAMISQVIDPIIEQLKDVIKEEDSRRILRTDLRRMESLLLDIITLFRDEPDIITTLFQSQKKTLSEIVKRLRSLKTSLTEAKRRRLPIDRSVLRQSCTDRVPKRLSRQIRDWNASFDEIYHGFQSEFSILVTSLQFLSDPLHIQKKEKEPTLIQPSLSSDESWMLFCRVAFKDQQVSMDIEERARRFADECKGMPLAINIVAAIIGQTSVDHWDTCFSLIKSVDPPTHPRLDGQLYRLLRWSYDALPNSSVKNCFLYSAIYMNNEEIDSRDLLQMWIGEGLVQSKQGTYLMDMALARKYLKLLVDRCFFQIVRESTYFFRERGQQAHDFIPSIRVDDAIREMAMYVGQKEENCLFMASQNLRHFPEVHNNNNCRRISVANNFIEDLPTELRCPELASLILKGNTNLKKIPSEFVLSLTSLRVLNLSGCTHITSLPASMGQLSLLEFLSLSGLPIKDLPEEICNLSRLQFLNLSECDNLLSLPSKIAELKNLKYLDLNFCSSLSVIPRQMSELTSLSRLVLPWRSLSKETEALKGLKNMTEFKGIQVEDGIMGTWSEMRHLMLSYDLRNHSDEDLLPEDMKSMKKLQSFILQRYRGYHCLPNCCKFEHLEMVSLFLCNNIRELSPLEWMPNLKLLILALCNNLRELGIGSRGGYQRLQKLALTGLRKLESLGGASKTREGVWDERTLPHLRVLEIIECRSLKRFPIGMEKLPNLCVLKGKVSWWESIIWEDDGMKTKFTKIFKHS